MHDLMETRKKLISALGSELSERYFTLFKEWFKFKSELTQIQFHFNALKLLKTDEQRDLHHAFFNAILAKVPTQHKQPIEHVFVIADATDSFQNNSPEQPPQNDHRSAALEYFLPDNKFMMTKIELHAWENGLDGAEESVAPFLVNACQVFIKNIVTAMISRKRSYRIREGNFQYGFGFPVPDPQVKNTENIKDHARDRKTTLLLEEDTFAPTYRPTLERIEQQTSFAYACGKRGQATDKLTVKLLYETLRDNPNITGMHSINSVQMLKVGLHLDD